MSKKKETPLQERIQKYVKSRGGYVIKNHGDMISEPGIADLTICYKGFYLALEVKVDKNTPSEHQGIEARKVHKAGGISAVVWSVEEVKTILNCIDAEGILSNTGIKFALDDNKIDDGTRW